jgi:hypothetical protein
MDPALAPAHFNCALLYERAGDRPRAVGHWQRFLELARDPGDSALARRRLDRPWGG